jgi:hypothetical protein
MHRSDVTTSESVIAVTADADLPGAAFWIAVAGGAAGAGSAGGVFAGATGGRQQRDRLTGSPRRRR